MNRIAVLIQFMVQQAHEHATITLFYTTTIHTYKRIVDLHQQTLILFYDELWMRLFHSKAIHNKRRHRVNAWGDDSIFAAPTHVNFILIVELRVQLSIEIDTYHYTGVVEYPCKS